MKDQLQQIGLWACLGVVGEREFSEIRIIMWKRAQPTSGGTISEQVDLGYIRKATWASLGKMGKPGVISL